jgi:hypothetical protein
MENKGNLDRAKAMFRCRGGVLRTRDAIKGGVHPRMLYPFLGG